MTHLLTVDSLISLVTLALLEIVLGIDNVIFVSILMGRLKTEQKLAARRLWMILGISSCEDTAAGNHRNFSIGQFHYSFQNFIGG